MSSTKIPSTERSQCSWTLYFIFLTTFNTNSEFIASFFRLSADTFLPGSGLLMIPIHQSIKNSKRMNFRSSQISARIGPIRNWFLTLKNVTARKSGPLTAGLRVIFQMIAVALAVVLPNHFYIRIMVPKDSFSARSVIPDSLRKKVVFPQSGSVAHTAETPLFQRKTGNTSSSINVWIQNALIIFIIFVKLTKKICLKTMVKISISSTTSTANSR